MKKLLILSSVVALSFSAVRCGTGTSSGSGANLTTAGKMSSGLGGSVSTIQKVGGAMGANGTFMVAPMSTVDTLAAATKCTKHGDPGTDSNSDGAVTDGSNGTSNERYMQTDTHFALQSFYCALSAETSGPETVAGSVNMLKTIVCAVEKQIGTLAFDNVPVAISGITIDTRCATADQITGFNNGVPASSVVLPIAGGATVTSALNPNFSEIPGNVHYSHGIRIASNTANLLKYIIVAKFDAAVAGDPVDSGNFEFATYGTGTMMQGTGIEYTAGKISGGSATTKHLWYESRVNRVKVGTSDPVCQPGDPTASSCGFSRHTRLSTDISFSSGEVSSVSNMSGIISDSGDTNESGNSNHMLVITATGNLATGLTGKYWSKSTSPNTLTTGVSTIGNSFSGLEIGTTTCIMSAGSSVTTACGGAPAPLIPTGTSLKAFLLPPNTSAWIVDASAKLGLGFSGAATVADEQFVNP